MKRSNFTRTTLLPLALLVYLAVLAWMGRGRFHTSRLEYLGIIAGSLLIIGVLWLVLRRRDRLRQQWDDEQQYGTYADDEDEKVEDN